MIVKRTAALTLVTLFCVIFSVASHALVIDGATYSTTYEGTNQLDIHFSFTDTMETETFTASNIATFIDSIIFNGTELYGTTTSTQAYASNGLFGFLYFSLDFNPSYCANQNELKIRCNSDASTSYAVLNQLWTYSEVAAASTPADKAAASVPEPSSLLLLGVGLLGLGLSRRKSRSV